MPSHLEVLAMGFWLPIGRSNFFDSGEGRDKEAIEGFLGYQMQAGKPLAGDVPIPVTEGNTRLNASVYWRLISVLPSSRNTSEASGKRYSHAYPLYDVSEASETLRTEPSGIVLTGSKHDPDGGFLMGPEWNEVRELVQGIALLVVSDGFYVWRLLYTCPDDPETARPIKEKVRGALAAHIRELVGGDFFNRAADDLSPDYVEVDKGGKQPPTLALYRDDNLGILNFFQIHLIFEGMYNAALDPRVYLDKQRQRSGNQSANNGVQTEGDHDPTPAAAGQAGDGTNPTSESDSPDNVKAQYSLGNFVHELITEILIRDTFSLGPKRDAEACVEQMETLLHLPTSWSSDDYFTFFDEIRRGWANADARRDLLREFLRFTSTETLHLTKWRIESCSRMLLREMISIANLRRPLIQAEIPRSKVDRNNKQEKYVLSGANEAQLRGYVMLLAAKLPLIENVQHYLQNNREKLLEDVPDPKDWLQGEGPGTTAGDSTVQHARNYWRSINGLWRSWDSLLTSIRDSIEGLEQALAQANMDDMLEETQALRDEEETRAEIERIQERTAGGLTPSANATVGVIANVVAAASVLFVVANYGSALLSFFTSKQLPFWLQPWNYVPKDLQLVADILFAIAVAVAAVAALVVIFVVLASIYVLAQVLTTPALSGLFRLASKVESRRRKVEEQYYYEMDLDLPVDMVEGCALALFRGEFTQTQSTGDKDPRGSRYLPRVATRGFRPQRTSYHVNRVSAGSAQHKIYVAATVYWPRAWLGPLAWWLSRYRMRIYVVYEVLFHTRSAAPTYRLQKLRVVSTTAEAVKAERLDELKHLVADVFIKPWTGVDLAKPADEGEGIEAFFSMTAARPGSTGQGA